MSVINRMLRDLDKRQQQQPKGVSMPAAVAPKPFPWGWLLGALVIIAIAVTAVMVIWQTMRPQDDAETDVVQVQDEVMQPTIPVTNTDQHQSSASSEQTMAAPAAQVTQPQQRLQPQPVVIEPMVAETPAVATNAEPKQSNTEEPNSAELPPEKPKGTMQVERVELSAAELAEVKLKQARDAIQKGERERAAQLFEQVIALAPEHVAARSELAAYWYGRGQIASALAVLEQGLALQPLQSQWQLLTAKILLEGGAYERVLDTLSTIELNTDDTLDLYQLRATAANEMGAYQQAEQDYRVLAQNTQQGRWWLAAAVAAEDAGQPDNAVEAYRSALAQDDLSDDAVRYAQQRLQILGDF